MTLYYVTKYALSRGIQQYDCEPPPFESAFVYAKENHWQGQFKVGRDAFVDYADAVLEANRMRDNRVESLKKSIRRLEKMRFDK
jgi:hypothetical protein